MNIWNDFLMPLLVLPSNKVKKINVETYTFIDQFVSRWDIVFVGVICGIIPILIIFNFLQMYFDSGISTGVVKG